LTMSRRYFSVESDFIILPHPNFPFNITHQFPIFIILYNVLCTTPCEPFLILLLFWVRNIFLQPEEDEEEYLYVVVYEGQEGFRDCNLHRNCSSDHFLPLLAVKEILAKKYLNTSYPSQMARPQPLSL